MVFILGAFCISHSNPDIEPKPDSVSSSISNPKLEVCFSITVGAVLTGAGLVAADELKKDCPH